MDTKKELINKINESIKREKKRLNMVKSLPITELEGMFPEGEWSVGIFDFDFYIPYELGMINIVHKFAKEHFSCISESRWIQNKIAYCVLSCWYNGVSFDITFKSSFVGSTCVLNQIGTEMKETPIYEVVCSEGAKEF